MPNNEDQWIDEVLAFGYKDPAFVHDIHVLVGGEDKIAAAKATIKAKLSEARLEGQNEFNEALFNAITEGRMELTIKASAPTKKGEDHE